MPALRTRDTSRSLEVTTDVPAPPALAIVSPTPKTFAFPTQHNLSGSPYSSPSHSPFEPDRNPFATYAQPVSIPSPPDFPPPPYTTTTSSTARSFTPDSLRSTSPSPSIQKRRKSSCSSDTTEHRPKKGDDGYIKRPENAFILFRRKCCEDKAAAESDAANMTDGPQKKQRQADLSKTISQQWKSLGAEERQYWENLAKEKKKEHEQMYPNYVYRPQRSKDKDGRSKKSKSTSRRRGSEDDAGVKIFVPQQQSANRYQEISLPVVHHVYPASAEDNGPSLLGPILAKMPGDNLANGFDWAPNASYVPPSMVAPFNPQFVSMEFTQGLFAHPSQPLRRTSLMPISPPSAEFGNGPMASPLSRISPPSSNSSGSSSPSSPSTGPFTPSTANMPFSFVSAMPPPPNDFEHLGPLDQIDPALLQPQHDGANGMMGMDMSGEMHHSQQQHDQQQQQQDFSQFTWAWPESSTPAMLDNNWDINSIPSALLGEQALNGAGHMGMGMKMHGVDEQQQNLCGTGLDFGSDFSQALEGSGGMYGSSDPTLLGGYDDYISGTAFA